MNIAVLFDGAGLARLGLENAGHTCTGYELDPLKHHLSKFIGRGNCELADVRDVDISGFDAVWASPPCQQRSEARTQGKPTSLYSEDLLAWSLALPHEVLWVENVTTQTAQNNQWGTAYNAAQFLQDPLQCRNRLIAGRHNPPKVYRPYKRVYPEFDICPCVTASEYKGCASDSRRASRFYGRRLTVEEFAYHQGLQIPPEWRSAPEWFEGTPGQWKNNLYEAIGNGVPTYMAEAFGAAHSQVADKPSEEKHK